MTGLRRRVRPEEALLCAYGVLLVVLMAATNVWIFTKRFHPRLGACFLVLALLVFRRAYTRVRGTLPRREALRAAIPPSLAVIRDFLPLLITLVFYETLHDLTPVLCPVVVDGKLIAIDHALFGVDLSLWLDQFASPALTKVMVLCYASYFFAPGLLACSMYWRGQRALFRDFLVSMCVVTLVGYIGYLLVPAVGPFLYQAHLFHDRLPGGGHTAGAVIAAFDGMKGIARDCFPSLHTAHTTVVLVFAWRFSRKLFLAYLPIALGLYVSTLYLRFHYGIDVLAGFATAALAVYLGPRIERWWHAGLPVPSVAAVSASQDPDRLIAR